jgi:hypothetical protein
LLSILLGTYTEMKLLPFSHSLPLALSCYNFSVPFFHSKCFLHTSIPTH